MKKKIKLILFSIFIIFCICMTYTKVFALSCETISESKIKYVNASLFNINEVKFNESARNMTQNIFDNLSIRDKYNLDKNLTLMPGDRWGGLAQYVYKLEGEDNIIYYTNQAAMQGLVKNTLSNNNIVLTYPNKNDTSFFPTEVQSTGKIGSGKIYQEILRNWKFPFLQQESGYYVFDSDLYHISKNYNSKKMLLHKGERSGFYPFNNCSDDVYNIDNRELHFSVKIEVPFTMTSDGKVRNKNGQKEDMIFSFLGDDDVWVFVDNKLALDIGGGHVPVEGYINFAKNQSWVEGVVKQDDPTKYYTNVYNNNLFGSNLLDEGKHTLQIFYMERYGGGSNLKATFNMQEGGIKANYIDKNTNTILKTDTQTGILGDIVTTSSKTIEGYTLIEKPNNENYTITDTMQETNYYYAKNTKVNVSYIDINTNTTLADTVYINGYEGKSYQTEKKDISNYIFIKSNGVLQGKMARAETNITYYYAKKTKVNVNYLEKGTNMILGKQIIDGYEGKYYETQQKDFNNYTFVESSNNTKGTMERNEKDVNYYYLQKTSLDVKHIDRATGEVLKIDTFHGLVGDKIKISKQNIENYTLIEKPEKEEWNLIKDKQEVIYYYVRNTKLTIRYIDKNSKNKLAEDVIMNGYEGKHYKTELKDFKMYALAGVIGKTIGIMPRQETIITYQYLREGKINVEYINKSTGGLLENKEINGLEGEKVKLHAIEIPGYILVEEPQKSEYIVSRDIQKVRYYYSAISKGIIEKHIDFTSGFYLEESIHEGKEGDQYSILPKEFDGYELVKEKLPINAIGTMQKEAIEVKYYYVKKANVIVNYINKISNEILERKVLEGYKWGRYEAERKEFEQYQLDKTKLPKNEIGIMQDETITVNFYYIHKAGGVIVNHIDQATGEILQSEHIEGLEQNRYITYSKNIENYMLQEDKLPNNSSGELQLSEIIVNYYYLKKASIQVNYIDDINKQIIKSEEIQGLETKEYETEPLRFLNYELIEKKIPNNQKGKFKREIQKINYYYIYSSTLTINYIDQDSGKILDVKIIKQYENDTIDLEEKVIEGYQLIRKPEKLNYQFTKENQTLEFYYKKDTEEVVVEEKQKEPEKEANKKILPKTGMDNYQFFGLSGIIVSILVMLIVRQKKKGKK